MNNTKLCSFEEETRSLRPKVPVVSVIMAVWNCEDYLCEAVDSILLQTFSEFEFIIVDDGSTDGSYELLQQYNDDRIRLIKNSQNLGLAACLNKGLALAKGEFIVRMDADDISLPHRLERQVCFMEENKAITVCGSYIEIFGAANLLRKKPVVHDDIKIAMCWVPGVCHPTVILRASFLKEHDLYYNEEYIKAQDYELWFRLLSCSEARFANIPEVLLRYRKVHKPSAENAQQRYGDAVRKMFLETLGVDLTPEDLIVNDFLYRGKGEAPPFPVMFAFVDKLIRGNRKVIFFDRLKFERLISDKLVNYFKKSKQFSLRNCISYFLSVTGNSASISKTNLLKIIVKHWCRSFLNRNPFRASFSQGD